MEKSKLRRKQTQGRSYYSDSSDGLSAYRGRLKANKDADSTGNTFQAEQVIAIGWDINLVYDMFSL